jgi:hypothetical protein
MSSRTLTGAQPVDLRQIIDDEVDAVPAARPGRTSSPVVVPGVLLAGELQRDRALQQRPAPRGLNSNQ